MPRLKICGVTSAATAAEVAASGADVIGFVFADGSPRRVTPGTARAIVAATPGPRYAGVFRAASTAEILRTARSVPLDIVQLHGGEEPGAVRAAKAAGFETWRLDDGGGPAGEDATIVDGRDGSNTGGTGKLADWRRAESLKKEGRRVVLAGGISAANIAAAVATGADVIDVNSSLETAPGVKSPALIRKTAAAFFEACEKQGKRKC